MAVKQTAGRDQLGSFAPQFAQLNDDVLFGQVWSREDALSLRDRSLVTVVALLAQGLVDSSFQYHLATAKQNGITRTEIAEIITHAAFYAGWPKAWAAFRMAKEVWADEEPAQEPHGGIFGLGQPNDAYAQYFVGHSYLKMLAGENGVTAANVTFEPGCRNNWHIHHADQGPLSRAAATTGTFTTPTRAAARFSCAPPAAAGIRNGARRPSLSPPATPSPFPPGSSTGTAQPGTAGSPTLRWKCPAKAPATSGASR